MARRSLIAILALVAAVGVVVAYYLAAARDYRAAERADCTAVAQFLGGSPFHKPGFVVREVMHPRPSGNAALDSAMQQFAAGLRGNDTPSANMAFDRFSTICHALGMWTAYH